MERILLGASRGRNGPGPEAATLPPVLPSFQLSFMAIPQLRPPAEPDQHSPATALIGVGSAAPVAPRVPIHKEDPNKQIQLDRMKRRAAGLLIGATVLFIVSLAFERQFPW